MSFLTARYPSSRPSTTMRFASVTSGLVLALLVGFVFADAVRAQLPPLPMPPPPPTATQRLVGDLAHRVMTDAGTDGKGRTYRIEVSATHGASGGLAPLLADALAAAMRQRGWSADRRPDVRAKAGTGGATSVDAVGFIFDLEISLKPPRLIAALRLREQPSSVWQRMRVPAGVVLAATHAEVPLDAELRVMLGKAVKGSALRRGRLRNIPVVAAARGHKSPLGPPLDMWLGDVRGDRRPKLLVLHRDRLVQYALGKGRTLVTEHSFAFDGEPPSPAKVRDPLGRIVSVVGADGRRTFLVAVSDLLHAVALRATDQGFVPAPGVKAHELGWPLYASGVAEVVAGAWPLGRDVLTGSAHSVRLDGTARRPAGPLIPVHDIRGFAHAASVEPRHSPYLVAAVAGGGVGIRDREGAAAIGRHGLGSVVGDMDVDGVAELLVTSGNVRPGKDVVTIYRLDSTDRRRLLRRLSVRGSVTALTTGDLDGDGLPEYWLAAWSGRKARLFALGLAKP